MSFWDFLPWNTPGTEAEIIPVPVASAVAPRATVGPVAVADVLRLLPDAVKAVAPRVDAAVWASALLPPMRSSGLTTAKRAAMFLGQCAEESAGFTTLVENLNYNAERLPAVWPSRFPTPQDARVYAHNPETLANHVYCDREGNGNEASGDGWRFRGAGLIQLTGRDKHTRFGAAVGKTPEDAAAWMQTPAGAVASACWYWLDRGKLLDPSDAWDIPGVTQRVNGGQTGLAARTTLCNAALAALGG